MARPCYCRFCGHPAEIIAGVFPASCEKCDGSDHWSTQPPAAYLEPPKKYAKRARVKFDLTALDKKLLQRLRIAAN